MSLPLTRTVLRATRTTLRNTPTLRNASSVSETASSTAAKAKESASQATSKASEGLSRVSSSGSSAVGKAASSASGAISSVSGRVGQLVSLVQSRSFFSCLHLVVLGYDRYGDLWAFIQWICKGSYSMARSGSGHHDCHFENIQCPQQLIHELGAIPPTLYYSRVGLELGRLIVNGQKMSPP